METLTYVNWDGTQTDLTEWRTERLRSRLVGLVDLVEEYAQNDDGRLRRVSLNLAAVVAELIDRDEL